MTELRETASLDALAGIEDRVLWLSTAIVDHANRVRPNPTGLKVGGHQASRASMVSIMTSLWFGHLRPRDRVSVKPHASPVLHAINYLLGQLDESYLTDAARVRRPAVLPEPRQGPRSGGLLHRIGRHRGDGADLGRARAPLRRRHSRRRAPRRRQYSLLGDAELDEGAVWEAVVDPMVADLGEVVWIVDLNRQSLDRVVQASARPGCRACSRRRAGRCSPSKYGHLLEELFARPGGRAAARPDRPDAESGVPAAAALRPGRAAPAPAGRGRGRWPPCWPALDDAELAARHPQPRRPRPGALDEAFAAIDDTRPTVIFAYTVKGYGLAIEGHPQNHSALLTEAQLGELAAQLGADPASPWLGPRRKARPERCAGRPPRRLPRGPAAAVPRRSCRPISAAPRPGRPPRRPALGRALLDLNRAAPEAGARIVTVSPDVSSSTNLGGWVNKVGVWSAGERTDWFADDAETILHWREQPTGQHIELGIAESNLVGVLGELGATWSRWGQPLFPIGVLYDPFVARALEPWSFGIYAGGQSILVGTPSGVSLAPEGGAHQSIITPSIGIEQPGCVSYEPAFAVDTEWCLLASLARLGRPDGSSAYLRLSTRPVDQTLAAIPADPAARERRRRQVVAGAYPLRRAPGRGARGRTASRDDRGDGRGRARGAGRRRAARGGRDAGRRRLRDQPRAAVPRAAGPPGAGPAAGPAGAEPWILDQAFPAARATPLVTVLDGHPHTLSFLATVNRVPHVALGVAQFGQSGALEDLYRYNGIDADSIVRAALDLAG